MDGDEKKLDAIAPVAGERGSSRFGLWFGLICGLSTMFLFAVMFGIGGQDFFRYVDRRSFAIIFGTVFGGWMIAYGCCLPFRLLFLAISGRAADANQARRVRAFCSCGTRLSLLAGAMGAIVGLIQIIVVLLDTGQASLNTVALTPGIVLCVLSLFWSVVLTVLLVALRYRAKETCRALEPTASNLK